MGSAPDKPLAPATAIRRPSRRPSIARAVLYLVLAAAAVTGGVLGFALLTGMNEQPDSVRSATVFTQRPPEFSDTLTSNERNWLSDSQCFFADGAYHAYPGRASGSVLCVAPAGRFADFDLHVTAQEVTGPLNYPYGLAFRRSSAGNFYIFGMDGDGLSWFGRYANGYYQQLSPYWATSPCLHGLQAACTLRVVARGSRFTFYVQGAQVGAATDRSYANGMVGVFSGYSQVDAAFTDFGISDAA